MTEVYFLPAKKLRLRQGPGGALLFNLDGQSVVLAPPKRALPLSDPDHFIVLSDAEGNELGVLRDVAELEPASRAVLQEALQQTYIIERILRILEVEKDTLTGQTRWRVEISGDAAEPAGADMPDEEPAAPDEAADGSDAVGLAEHDHDASTPKALGTVRWLRRLAGDKSQADGDSVATHQREFMINGQEDVQTARYPHIYIVDIDRNRYEILDCEALDIDSRRAAERFF